MSIQGLGGGGGEVKFIRDNVSRSCTFKIGEAAIHFICEVPCAEVLPVFAPHNFCAKFCPRRLPVLDEAAARYKGPEYLSVARGIWIMGLIRFIPPSTGKESQHEKELERARQLSHAAKISHARRKIKEISALRLLGTLPA